MPGLAYELMGIQLAIADVEQCPNTHSITRNDSIFLDHAHSVTGFLSENPVSCRNY